MIRANFLPQVHTVVFVEPCLTLEETFLTLHLKTGIFSSRWLQRSLKLVIIILGKNTPSGIKFKQLVVYNKARWVTKEVYSLTISSFKEQISFNKTEETTIKDIWCFIIKCCTEPWFSCTNKFLSTISDFFKWLGIYEKDNKRIAESSTKKVVTSFMVF